MIGHEPRDRRVVEIIADRDIGAERGGRIDRRAGKTQRREHVIAHIVAIGLAGPHLDHAAQQAIAQVRIAEIGPRHADDIGITADRFGRRRRAERLILVKELHMQRQPRHVIGHAAHRHVARRADPRVELRAAQIILDRAIKVDLPLCRHRHQRGAGKGFGDRRERIDRIGVRPHLLLAIGPAKALFPIDPAIAIDGDRDRRRLFLAQLGFDDRAGGGIARRRLALRHGRPVRRQHQRDDSQHGAQSPAPAPQPRQHAVVGGHAISPRLRAGMRRCETDRHRHSPVSSRI